MSVNAALETANATLTAVVPALHVVTAIETDTTSHVTDTISLVIVTNMSATATAIDITAMIVIAATDATETTVTIVEEDIAIVNATVSPVDVDQKIMMASPRMRLTHVPYLFNNLQLASSKLICVHISVLASGQSSTHQLLEIASVNEAKGMLRIVRSSTIEPIG